MLYEDFEYTAFGIYVTKPTQEPVSMSSCIYLYVELLHLLTFFGGLEVGNCLSKHTKPRTETPCTQVQPFFLSMRSQDVKLSTIANNGPLQRQIFTKFL